MYGGFEKIAPDRTLISEAFDNAGYATGGFQSNPHLLQEFGYGRGYDRYFGSNTEASSTSRLRQFVKRQFDDESLPHRVLQSAFDFSERVFGYNPGEPFVRADEKTDEALDWVERVDEPVFLWVHYMDVHHPYHPPAEHQLTFRDATVSKRTAVRLRRKMLEAPANVTETEMRTIQDLYDGEIRFFDAEMHRLVEGVCDRLSGETMVAVTSDHGDEFNDHHGFAHYDTFYDELLHIPLLLDIGGSGKYDELVSLIDLAPTLLSYADVDIPDSFVGDNLQSVIDEEGWQKEAVIAESGTLDGEYRCGYQTPDWKYIRNGNHRQASNKPDEELYDLGADPGEYNNVIGQPTPVTGKIREAVAEHKARVEATERTVETVEIDATTEQRLEDLGYK